LTYCDLITGPDGSRVTLECRLAEICERYGADHTTTHAMQLALPEFERARRKIELRLSGAHHTNGGLTDRKTLAG
jgi:hypothetical protein